MNLSYKKIVLTFLISNLFLPLVLPQYASEKNEDYLIKLNVDKNEISGIELEPLDIPRNLESDEIYLWKKVENINSEDLNVLKNNPSVKNIQKEIQYKLLDLPDDTYFNSLGNIYSSKYDQWNLRNIGLNPIKDIPDYSSGWDYSTGSTSTIIAVIDSGIDLTHPDLQDNIIAGRNFSPSTAHPSTNDVADELGHGTHVAGIIAGVTNNEEGIAGICWNCKIMPLRVFGNTNATNDIKIAAAINYAVDNGANVINLSLTGFGYSQIVQDSLDYAWENGVVSVAASGNDADDASFYSPAGLRNVITVGAVNILDNYMSFSNYGPRVDLTAPGVYVLSTKLRSLPSSNCVESVNYYCLSGTSMAAPHVAGVAALLYDYHKDDAEPWTNIDIRNVLLKNIDDKGSIGFDNLYGYGRLNALKSLQIEELDLTLTTPEVSIDEPDFNYFGYDIAINGSVSSDDIYIYNLIFERGGNIEYLYSGRENITDNYLINSELSLPEGFYNVTLLAEDFSGSISSSSDIEVNVDLTPPNSFSIDESLNNNTATFAFSTTDAASGLSHYEVSIDNGEFTVQISPYTTPVLSNGDHLIKVKAVDRVANERIIEEPFTIYSRAYMLKSVGDLSGNGIVDLSDLSILASNWNQNTSNGDVNSNGVVDISDLSILAQNWLKSF